MEMRKLQANRKLIHETLAEKTGKRIVMKDIHNIAVQTKVHACSCKETADVLDNWITETDCQFFLAGVSIRTVGKKRGRPKGSIKTAIGLLKGKRIRLAKNIPFQQKDMQACQRQVLSWFVNEEDIVKAVSGDKLD